MLHVTSTLSKSHFQWATTTILPSTSQILYSSNMIKLVGNTACLLLKVADASRGSVYMHGSIVVGASSGNFSGIAMDVAIAIALVPEFSSFSGTRYHWVL